MRLHDLNDYEERRCILLMINKLKYSPKTYTEEELIRIFNPYGQENLTKLSDLAEKNKPISITDMAKILYKWGFIRVSNNLCYARKPYTFNYIIPILKDGRLVGYDEELVLSRKIEDKLQEHCNKQLNGK